MLHIHLSLLHWVKKISKFIKNIKLFYTCHSKPEIYFTDLKAHEGNAAKNLIKHNNLQMIALYNDMCKEINEMFGISNTVVIRNGVDFKKFKNVQKNKDNIRLSLNIPENAFVIGHVGRFSKVKNHDFLANVFAEMCKRKNNAFLLMIGEGELKQQTENKLNSYGLNDKYLILSHRTDIPELMKAMNVFVFPSLYEGFPIVLIEAQVSGLRCIISDTVPNTILI